MTPFSRPRGAEFPSLRVREYTRLDAGKRSPRRRAVDLTIDGRQVAAEPGTTILQAARTAGIDIPTLCQDDRLEPFAACLLCLVELEPATWDEALDLVAERFGAIKAEHGADALAGFSSARCTNEDNYVFQKLVRAVWGTQNVDHCARLCHSSTITGLRQSLGSGAMTNSFKDLEDAEAILIIGSNTSEAHPIGALHIKKALRKGAKLIVVDPRRIDMARRADVHLQLLPGTNVAVVNGIMHVILEEGLADKEFIAARTEGFDE